MIFILNATVLLKRYWTLFTACHCSVVFKSCGVFCHFGGEQNTKNNNNNKKKDVLTRGSAVCIAANIRPHTLCEFLTSCAQNRPRPRLCKHTKQPG